MTEKVQDKPKQAVWDNIYPGDSDIFCSNCKVLTNGWDRTLVCPNCGATMTNAEANQ